MLCQVFLPAILHLFLALSPHLRSFPHNVQPVYHMATGFVKHFRQAGALCLSGTAQCLLGRQVSAWVSQGILFFFCTASGLATLWAGIFSSRQGAGEQSVAWKLISLLVIFFYLFNVCGLEWCFVVLGGKL